MTYAPFTVIQGGKSDAPSAEETGGSLQDDFQRTHPYLRFSAPSIPIKSAWETCPLLANKVEEYNSALVNGYEYYIAYRTPLGSTFVVFDKDNIEIDIQNEVFNLIREQRGTRILMAMHVEQHFTNALPEGLGHPPTQEAELVNNPLITIPGITAENLHQVYTNLEKEKYHTLDPALT